MVSCHSVDSTCSSSVLSYNPYSFASVVLFADHISQLFDSGTNASNIGVWWYLEGTGSPIMARLDNTTFDRLSLSVYAGGCSDPVCVTHQGNPFVPAVWDSVEGEMYKVFVYTTFATSNDAFDLVAEETEHPENDVCGNAIVLVMNEPTLEGTTISAFPDEGLNTCEGSYPERAIGLWYSFKGNGNSLFVGVTFESENDLENFRYYGFSPYVQVFSGSCGDLTCVDSRSIYPFENYTHPYVVETVEDEIYFVFVSGIIVSGRAGVGDFKVQLLEILRPENDACDSALSLEVNDNVSGSTSFAFTKDEMLVFETCGTSEGGYTLDGGLWYTAFGTGDTLEAVLHADYCAQLTVFSGDNCENLVCTNGTKGEEDNYDEDWMCWPCNVVVSWPSVEDTLYYIFVHGFGSERNGKYRLTLFSE